MRLAKTALERNDEEAKNVAAVLAAAAFEDTIRRMGEKLVGISTPEDLQTIISTLKAKDILRPPQLGIALSYLNFRNQALHANWDKIDRSSVASAIGFVEQLLIVHFS